jgi:N-acetylglutamate synthase-like GNAT family acetyltransferase
VGGVPDRLVVRPVRPDEGERLREIAIASKSHWGYEETQVRDWAAQGDFSPEALAAKEILVAEADDRAVGFATLISEGDLCVLDDLWLEPDWIGRGLGSKLFEACANQARQLGAKRLEWEAEPNAVGFYEKMGGRYVRDSDQTPFGRVIPVMGLDL